MRKLLLCLFVLVSLLCVSCLTSSFTFSNRYSCRSYSSYYGKTPITDNGLVVICVGTTDYNFNRPMELELKNRFERQGYEVEILTDYNFKDDEIFTFISSFNPQYVLLISVVEGSLYTYEYGGGISRLGLECEVYDFISFEKIMKISSNVDGDENNGESYSSSIETISPKFSQGIVSEFCKYR